MENTRLGSNGMMDAQMPTKFLFNVTKQSRHYMMHTKFLLHIQNKNKRKKKKNLINLTKDIFTAKKLELYFHIRD